MINRDCILNDSLCMHAYMLFWSPDEVANSGLKMIMRMVLVFVATLELHLVLQTLQ